MTEGKFSKTMQDTPINTIQPEKQRSKLEKNEFL